MLTSPQPAEKNTDKDDFLESIKRLNAEMKSQMDEHRTALTKCEEKMKTGQQEIALDLVLGVKEELKGCRAQVENLTAATQQSSKDDSYQKVVQDGGCEEREEKYRTNLEKSLSLLKSCQSQIRNNHMVPVFFQELVLAELGTRQHYCDSFRQNNWSIFVASTPIRHQGINIHRIFSCLYSSIALALSRVVVVAKLKHCRVPSAQCI